MRAQRNAQLMIVVAMALRELGNDGGIIQVALGIPDGENQVFETSHAYEPSSLVVLVNGEMLVQAGDHGWEELHGTQFRLKCAPRPSDVIFVCYLPA